MSAGRAVPRAASSRRVAWTGPAHRACPCASSTRWPVRCSGLASASEQSAPAQAISGFRPNKRDKPVKHKRRLFNSHRT